MSNKTRPKKTHGDFEGQSSGDDPTLGARHVHKTHGPTPPTATVQPGQLSRLVGHAETHAAADAATAASNATTAAKFSSATAG